VRFWIKLALAAVAFALLIFAAKTLPLAQWLEHFTAYVRQLGFTGYLLYILVYAVCCVLLIPASALTIGAGAIFGFAAGAVVVSIGATLGAVLAFLLARTVFRRRVERYIENDRRLSAIDRAIAAEGTKVMLLMRLSGFPPFTWINYALGATGVSLGSYVLTTFFGNIPGILAFTWAGVAGAAAVTGSGNRVTLIITAAGAIVVSGYIARIATRAIKRAGVETGPTSP
jgi:uncharacterized membrane protein YdjX (TVP38/TMEM64 family)